MPLEYDNDGQAALAGVVQGVLDAAVDEGLIVASRPRVVIHPPSEQDRADRRINVDLVFADGQVFGERQVVDGRAQELWDRIDSAVTNALDPRNR